MKNSRPFVFEPLDPRTLLSAGDLDASFGSGGIMTLPLPAAAPYTSQNVLHVALPSGKFEFINADHIRRFNSDLSVDKTFGNKGDVAYTSVYPIDVTHPIVNQHDATDHQVVAATALHDGSLIVATEVIQLIHATPDQPDASDYKTTGFLFKFKPDGSIDRSFGTNGVVDMSKYLPYVTDDQSSQTVVRQIAEDSSGRLVFTARFGLIVGRLLSDGKLDTSFGNNGLVDTTVTKDINIESLDLQSDGKIVIGGQQSSTNKPALARLTTAGALDLSFGTQGVVTYDGGTGATAHVMSDDRLMVTASRKISPSGQFQTFVARLKSNGSPDTSFSGDGRIDGVYFEAVEPDNSVLVKKPITAGTTVRLHYTSEGTLDQNFGTVVDSSTGVFAFDAKGRALAWDGKNHVARFVMNDTDPSAGPVFKPDANGKVRMVGTNGADDAVVREEADGTVYLSVRKIGRAFKASQIKSLSVDLLGGNDTFVLKNLASSLTIPMTISGGAGNDNISAAAGNDILNGDDGNDSLFGGLGNDELHGGIGNDSLRGDAGNDRLSGDDGNDTIYDGPGADKLFGGNGNDKFVCNDGTRDSVSGGPGTDTCIADGNDVLSAIEKH